MMLTPSPTASYKLVTPAPHLNVVSDKPFKASAKDLYRQKQGEPTSEEIEHKLTMIMKHYLPHLVDKHGKIIKPSTPKPPVDKAQQFKDIWTKSLTQGGIQASQNNRRMLQVPWRRISWRNSWRWISEASKFHFNLELKKFPTTNVVQLLNCWKNASHKLDVNAILDIK